MKTGRSCVRFLDGKTFRDPDICPAFRQNSKMDQFAWSWNGKLSKNRTNCLFFGRHPKSRPSHNQTHFASLNTRHVRYSYPHCNIDDWYSLISLQGEHALLLVQLYAKLVKKKKIKALIFKTTY